MGILSISMDFSKSEKTSLIEIPRGHLNTTVVKLTVLVWRGGVGGSASQLILTYSPWLYHGQRKMEKLEAIQSQRASFPFTDAPHNQTL